MSLVASSVMVCCPSRTKTRRLIVIHLMSIGCYIGAIVISTMEPDLVVRFLRVQSSEFRVRSSEFRVQSSSPVMQQLVVFSSACPSHTCIYLPACSLWLRVSLTPSQSPAPRSSLFLFLSQHYMLALESYTWTWFVAVCYAPVSSCACLRESRVERFQDWVPRDQSQKLGPRARRSRLSPLSTALN